MVFESEEGPHCPPDMVALRSRTSRLAALHPTELLEPSMIHFKIPLANFNGAPFSASLRHESGKLRRSCFCPRHLRQPRHQPQQVERDRRQEMLQVRLGQPNVAGMTQVTATVSLGKRPFYPRPSFVLCPELLRLLIDPRRLQRDML